jgi:branched-chain amino acid transport system substrate-binding protein
MTIIDQAKRRFALFLSALLLAGVLAGLRPAAAEEPYDLHVIIPLTGNAAFLGQEEQQFLKLLEGQVNAEGGIRGRPLRLIFHDDQTNPQVAVQIANEVIAQRPPIFLGPSIVAECSAIAPLLRDGPVMYAFSPGIHPPPGSNVFSVSTSTHSMMAALLKYFRSQGWTRMAAITSADATGQDVDKGIAQLLALPENKDITLVAHPHFAVGDVTVTAQIERIKAADPQVVVAWTTGNSVAIIFKAIVQTGMDVPVATTNGNQNHTQMVQYANFLPKQMYYASPLFPAHEGVITLDPRVEAAQQAMQKAVAAANLAPDNQTAMVWDPLLITVDALRKLGPDATAAQIREHIANITDFAGINGLYNFKEVPQRGLGLEAAIVTRWDPAQKRWLWVSAPGGAALGK